MIVMQYHELDLQLPQLRSLKAKIYRNCGQQPPHYPAQPNYISGQAFYLASKGVNF